MPEPMPEPEVAAETLDEGTPPIDPTPGSPPVPEPLPTPGDPGPKPPGAPRVARLRRRPATISRRFLVLE